jgi:hypothetical protein
MQLEIVISEDTEREAQRQVLKVRRARALCSSSSSSSGCERSSSCRQQTQDLTELPPAVATAGAVRAVGVVMRSAFERVVFAPISNTALPIHAHSSHVHLG